MQKSHPHQAKLYRFKLDLLRSRIPLLTGKDRVLMTMYLENGNSFRQISKLTGINESNIARRIYKITQRLLDGGFVTCLRNRDKLSSQELKIARDYLLNGLSMTKISKKRNISYHQIRKITKNIKIKIMELKNRRPDPA